MTTYQVQGPPHNGAQVTFVNPAGTAGDLAPTGVGQALLVNNQASAPITVTLPITPTYDGLAVASRTVSVPGTAAAGAQGGYELIPLPSSVYGVAPTPVQYSAIANVNVAVVRVP